MPNSTLFFNACKILKNLRNIIKKVTQVPFLDKGVLPPEFVVPPEPFFAELAKRQIWVYENDRKLNGLSNLDILLKKEQTTASV